MLESSGFDRSSERGKALSGVLERLKEQLVILDDLDHRMGAAWLSRAIDVIEADLGPAANA